MTGGKRQQSEVFERQILKDQLVTCRKINKFEIPKLS